MEVGLAADQPQPLPKLRFGDDLQRAGFDGLADRLVEPVVQPVASGKGSPSSPTTTRWAEASGFSSTIAPWRRTSCAASRRVMLARRPTKAMRLPRRISEVSLGLRTSADTSG